MVKKFCVVFWLYKKMAVLFSVQILSSLSKLNLRKMKAFSTKEFILFALATEVFLTSNSMCLNEPMKSRLESREESDDKYYEVRSVLLWHCLGDCGWDPEHTGCFGTGCPKLMPQHSALQYKQYKKSLSKEFSRNSFAQTGVDCVNHAPIFWQYSFVIRLQLFLKSFLLTQWILN